MRRIIPDRKPFFRAVDNGIKQPQKLFIFELAPQRSFQSVVVHGRVKLPNVQFRTILRVLFVRSDPAFNSAPPVMNAAVRNAAARVFIHTAHEHVFRCKDRQPVQALIREECRTADNSMFAAHAVHNLKHPVRCRFPFFRFNDPTNDFYVLFDICKNSFDFLTVSFVLRSAYDCFPDQTFVHHVFSVITFHSIKYFLMTYKAFTFVTNPVWIDQFLHGQYARRPFGRCGTGKNVRLNE